MKLFGTACFITLFCLSHAFGQKQRTFPDGVPVKETGVEVNGGHVEGRTYENSRFSFKVAFPEDWFIAGPDFEKVLKDNGHDLSTDTIARSGRPVDVLMTAFRSETSRPGAVFRIAAENLSSYPQIRDAVDYLDAITAIYASVKLPADFSYSSVKAEALGTKQFAYLDTTSPSGKKRLYATVQGRWAIMFTLSYSDNADLQSVRDILSQGTFAAGRIKI